MRFLAQSSYNPFKATLGIRQDAGEDCWQGHGQAQKRAFRLVQEPVIPAENPEPWCNEGLIVGGEFRIDNREELTELLYEFGITDRSSDAEYIAAAYLKWGINCPRWLVGDYAFLVWDEVRQQLFCARDALGVRTLFYELGSQGVRVAGELELLLDARTNHPSLHRPYIEGILEGRLDHLLQQTPYEHIQRLAPGHSLTVGPSGAVLDRYWPPPTIEPISLDEAAIYTRFRELFQASVKARLRSAAPVGLAVSGGIDSSCLAVTAHALVAADPRLRVPVALFHKAFSQTRQADERGYFQAVAAACGSFSAQEVPCDDCWGLRETGGDRGFPMGEPDLLMNRAPLTRLAETAAAAGCRVMIGGYGGDQVLGGEPYHLPSVFADVRPSRWRTEFPHFRRYSRTSSARLLATACGASVLPESAMESLRRRMRLRDLERDGLPLRRPARRARPAGKSALRLPAQSSREMYRQLMHGAFQGELAGLNTVARLAGMEWRHAFLDRPLVEFMLSVPGDTRFGGGVIKRIAREALADLLPPSVRDRSEIAHFGWLITSGLRGPERERLAHFVDNSELVRAGYLDHARLKRAWNAWSAVDGPYCYRELTNFLSLEAWLRHVTSGAVD